MSVTCQLFGTVGCHLCEMAETVLVPLIEPGLEINRIDIAEQESLLERYGLRIPVLRRCDNGKELNWPFDTEQVEQFLLG